MFKLNLIKKEITVFSFQPITRGCIIHKYVCRLSVA